MKEQTNKVLIIANDFLNMFEQLKINTISGLIKT